MQVLFIIILNLLPYIPMVKARDFTATCVYKKFVKKLYKNKMLIRIIPVIIAEIDMIFMVFSDKL